MTSENRLIFSSQQDIQPKYTVYYADGTDYEITPLYINGAFNLQGHDTLKTVRLIQLDIPTNTNIVLSDGTSYTISNAYPKLNFLKVFNIPIVNHAATISFKQSNGSYSKF